MEEAKKVRYRHANCLEAKVLEGIMGIKDAWKTCYLCKKAISVHNDVWIKELYD